MKRRAAALIFCVLLVFQLAVPPAEAAETVYFIAVGNETQPVSDQTMPFWSGGYLYIPATLFTGSVWRTLGIAYNYKESSQAVILYNSGGDRRSLMFYLDQNYAQDRDGNISYPGGILRNGVPYVPASLTAKYFGLDYSVTTVSHGYLVWLRKPGFGLTDREFADAATYNVEYRYSEYLKAKEPAGASDGSANTPNTADNSGKSIYLCLEADDAASQLLDTLDRYGAQAAFFCTPEFLRDSGDLLRRMIATGQTVGILADAQREDQSVEEQLRAGNQALELATCGKTRLAMVKNGDDAAVQAAEAAGFRCLAADLDRSEYDLKSVSGANTLFQRISARRGDVSVWLGNTVNTAGLRALLDVVQEADGRCLAMTEVA